MPSRRNPETVAPDDGLTAETAVQVMRTNPPVFEPTEETDDEIALLDRMRDLLTENDPMRVRLRLFRLSDGPKKPYAWLEDYTPQEYETGGLAMIRDKWGAGDYQLRLMGPRGLTKVLPILIEADPLKKDAPQVVQAAPQNSELAQVLAMLAGGQQKILEALTVKPDPMAQMTQMITLAGAMREAFAPAVQQGPQVNSLSMLKEVLDAAKQVKSTARELAGDDDKPAADPSDPMSMLPSIIDLVKTAVSSNQPPQATQPALPLPPIVVPNSVIRHEQQNPAQEIAPEQPSQPVPQSEDEMIAELAIRGLLEDLCQLAADGKPASEGGEFIYEKLPDQMIEHMQQRYWFEMVALKFPFVKPHEKWMREAKAEADKTFANPPPDDVIDDDRPNP